MGASSSKLEGDRALLLCRERKHFVRQALEGRCTLAAAHVSYIESLKNTGTALRKFVEPEAPTESSLYTSTSATPEPLALTEKSLSQISYSSPRHSHHVDPIENFSPTPSPPYSGRFHVSYMKARGISSTVVEERPPVPVSATLRSSSGVPKTSISRGPSEAQSFEPPSPPGTSAWDYFSPFHPIDHQFSFQDGRGLHRDLDNADDIKRFREAEKIPDLEDDEETSSFTPKEEGSSGSEDNFDEPSSVPLVQSYERRAVTMDSYSPSASPTTPPLRNTRQRKQLNGDKNMLRDEMDKADESGTPNMARSKSTPRLRPLPAEEKAGLAEEPTSEKLAPKDFLSSIKEIEFLFLKASEEGKEVPRMLEAKKLAFRPMFPEANVRRSRVSTLFSACLACMEEPEQVSQDIEPPVNGIKYLTWHRSTSSLSSSSRNLIGSTPKEEIMESNDNLFNSSYMNSGSHALTLDRLYAWERKLYDEIKASGIIRREYEMKCRLLRHQDSKGESPIKIDKTRAAVKDLHSRIRVSIHRIDSISKRIEELRDKELQPQLEELIEGLRRMWEMMVECHKLQFNIISVAYNNGHSKVSLQSESHRQATLLLEYELNSLCSSFTKWVGVQKFYLQAINGWLLKCVFPLRQKSVSRRNNVEFCPLKALAPPIFVTCRDWLNKLEELWPPAKEVVDGIKGLLKVTTCYLPRQEKAPKKDLTSSFSWKPEGVSETASDMMRNEGPADWNSGFESLQSSLVVFFEQLYNFSDTSAKKYRELEDAIKEAKRLYEHGGLRTQM